jgi:hypothetical protein
LGILVEGAALDPGARRTRQMLLESTERLLDELASVGEEEHALHSLLPLQQLDKGHCDARFPGAGRQDH